LTKGVNAPARRAIEPRAPKARTSPPNDPPSIVPPRGSGSAEIDNAYFRYHPAILTYRQHAALFDTYLNRTDTEGNVVEFRLNHISDEGYPQAQPLAPAELFFTSNVTIEAPEQTKYTVNLLMYYEERAAYSARLTTHVMLTGLCWRPCWRDLKAC